MALKYALYPYNSLPGNAGNFVVNNIEEVYVYPTEIDSLITDLNGQTQPIYSKYIPCILVHRDPFAVGHGKIINKTWDTWDSENPTNQKPVDMQVIFSEEEYDLIFNQVQSKTDALIAAYTP